MNLCAYDSEQCEHGREDVGIGWVCSMEVTGALGMGIHEMLHTETQMSIPPKYQQDCSAPDTVAAGAQSSLLQPRYNIDPKYLKYYTLQQVARGGHP